MRKKNTLRTRFLKYIRTVADIRYHIEEHHGIYYLVQDDVECASFNRINVKSFDDKNEAEEACEVAKREFILSEVSKRRVNFAR